MSSTQLNPLVVVDDSDEDFEALSRVLRATDSRDGVVRYRSGEEALAGLADRERPMLVLLDLNLPGLHGLDVLRALKGDPERMLVPVIVMSSSRRPEDVDAAYRAGANAYVVKPFEFDRLRRVVLSLHDFWQVAALPGAT